jgi:hypothetical protein
MDFPKTEDDEWEEAAEKLAELRLSSTTMLAL